MNRLRTPFAARPILAPWLPPSIVAVATIALFLWPVLPQWVARSDTVGDAPGHVAAAAFLRDQLLPALRGFQPQFFAGYELGQFYPPLFHWIIAVVGCIATIETAYRAVVACSVLLLPLALYRFARGCGATPARAVVAMLGSLAALAATPWMGGGGRAGSGTLFSTYVVGLGANAFALPVWLGFASLLPQALRRGGKSCVAAALLGAAVVLSHLVCGVAAAIFGAVAVLVSIGFSRSAKRRRVIRNAGVIAATTFALTAFFVLPYVLDRGVSAVSFIDAGDSTVTAVLATTAVLAVIVTRRPGSRNEKARGLSGAVTLAVFSATLAIGMYIGEWFEVAAHLDRFQSFAQLAAIGAITCGIPRGLATGIAGAIAAAIALAFGFAAAETLKEPEAPPSARFPRLAATSRVLVVGHPANTPGRHWLQSVTPRETGANGVIGLFVESAPTARFLFDLAACFEPDGLRWGVGGEVAETRGIREFARAEVAERASRLAWMLHAFGIDHVLTEAELPTPLADPSPRLVLESTQASTTRTPFFLHRVGDGSIVSIVEEGTIAFRDAHDPAFATATIDWLFSAGRAPLPSIARGGGPGAPQREDRKPTVETISYEPASPRVEFVVHADSPVPVVVKLGWHPSFVATGERGPIEIERAGNGLMIVSATGRVVLERVPRSIDRWAGWGSLATLLFVLLKRARWK